MQTNRVPISSKAPILLVEDSDDDYEAAIRAFQKSGNLSNEIIRCRSGEETLDYLFQRGEFGPAPGVHAPRPGLILLDLNMPGVDGRAVLKIIKGDRRLNEIPVIVMTTSDDERDVSECYGHGANSYIKKPIDLDGFFHAIKRLKEFWFEIALLPKDIHDRL
ncbi:response regulator [Kordiimonas sp.]|uniref:response regulator n=1 Tax=Kordiimonas sp. TaxID=1970157 RepID=UPI003A95287C